MLNICKDVCHLSLMMVIDDCDSTDGLSGTNLPFFLQPDYALSGHEWPMTCLHNPFLQYICQIFLKAWSPLRPRT